ncbi:MAG TPA: RodZ domain-containing protein [Acidimicrobiales bacterium]|nr:RodZ domain-containing protein [Acidimicrobiales bacterium]
MAAVALVAVLDVLALGVLAASYTGLLRRSGRGATGRSARTSAGPVLEPVASTQSTADYRVASPTYRITVAARYPCWVEVRAGASVLFAAVMTAGSSRSFSVSGRTNVEMGSGGGSVTVDADGQAQQVAPPSAPYTLTFSGA